RSGARPVMLATLDAPVAADAARVAVDAAVESGQPLLVVNVVARSFTPVVYAGWDTPSTPEVEESLRAPTDLAQALGVHVERLRVRTPHPVDALLEVAAERGTGLLVFGPERTTIRGRRYRQAARAIERRAACLVWLSDDAG
ncbi:MAG TPA: universal stress protein, partial [Gaiellaceae bacterium]|nr:universal stress protein [Gaiellaceae bacterium]